METIKKYFQDLTDEQTKQLAMLYELYHEWNEKINVVSRKDIDNLYLHHVLHSLAIARFIRFRPGTKILDFGTGGGFPGVPLAIAFPECSFTLIDGTGKKVKVAQAVIDAIGLTNCTALHRRGEEERGKYHFVVSRAVMPLPDLVKIVRKNMAKEQPGPVPGGIICLKGGRLGEELSSYARQVETVPLTTYFDEEWFAEKHVVYLPL